MSIYLEWTKKSVREGVRYTADYMGGKLGITVPPQWDSDKVKQAMAEAVHNYMARLHRGKL